MTGPLDQPRDVIGQPLEDRLDPAVGQVAHPAGHAVLHGQPPAGITEEHTLDPAGDQDPIANHKQKVRRVRAGRTGGRTHLGSGTPATAGYLARAWMAVSAIV